MLGISEYYNQNLFVTATFGRNLLQYIKISNHQISHDLTFSHYSAPRLNGQRLSSHFLAVKAGWPIIRANLM